MKLYGEISKTEAQDDGTVKVWGYASSSAVDSDGEIVTAEAMKAAIPDYMKFGAVREMHQAKAAGTAIEAEVQEDGRTYFGAHIVDSEAVKKVNAGVYKGFSIGGKVTGRDELNKSTVTGLKLIEISLVDRPANQEAIFTLVKFEDIDKLEKVDLKKYLGESIMDARQALNSLGDILWLFSDEVGEAEKNPDQIADLKAVIDRLKSFIISELKEPDPDIDAAAVTAANAMATPITLAATTDDIHKAGAEISAKNKEKAQAIHDHAVSLGAQCTPDTGKFDGNGNDLNRLMPLTEYLELQKVQSEHATIQKDYAHKTEALDKINKACGEAGCPEGELIVDFIKSMKAELEKIKSEPVAPKVSLNDKGVTITKEQDGRTESSLDDEIFVKDAHGNINEAATLIKLSHMKGGIRH